MPNAPLTRAEREALFNVCMTAVAALSVLATVFVVWGAAGDFESPFVRVCVLGLFFVTLFGIAKVVVYHGNELNKGRG